jgi:gas vesicle protein
MSRFDSSLFLAGLLIGGVGGGVAALLMAPESGRAMAAIRKRRHTRIDDPRVDEAIEESFPASDPPSWTPATTSVPGDGERM